MTGVQTCALPICFPVTIEGGIVYEGASNLPFVHLPPRTDGALFYSASNKHGQILSSFNEDLFGKLLCRVSRNELRVRGYVSPKLVFKIVRVKEKKNDSESRRNASRIKLDLDKAQSEAVAIISAYKDLQSYYENPNMITFGDHVEVVDIYPLMRKLKVICLVLKVILWHQKPQIQIGIIS